MSSFATRVYLSVFFGLALAVACKGDDKKGGGHSSDDAVPTPTPATTGSTTGGNPCLWLQDDGESQSDQPDLASETEQPDPTATPDSATMPEDCTPPETTGQGTGGETVSWNAGPGLEGCAALGKGWRAVVNRGPGECVDELVTDFCCTEEEALRQFPKAAASLTEYFGKSKEAHLKLYHCSHSGDKWTFHWGLFEDGVMHYRANSLSGATPVGGAPTDSCPKLTSDDLLIPANLRPGSGEALPTEPPAPGGG